MDQGLSNLKGWMDGSVAVGGWASKHQEACGEYTKRAALGTRIRHVTCWGPLFQTEF